MGNELEFICQIQSMSFKIVFSFSFKGRFKCFLFRFKNKARVKAEATEKKRKKRKVLFIEELNSYLVNVQLMLFAMPLLVESRATVWERAAE